MDFLDCELFHLANEKVFWVMSSGTPSPARQTKQLGGNDRPSSALASSPMLGRSTPSAQSPLQGSASASLPSFSPPKKPRRVSQFRTQDQQRIPTSNSFSSVLPSSPKGSSSLSFSGGSAPPNPSRSLSSLSPRRLRQSPGGTFSPSQPSSSPVQSSSPSFPRKVPRTGERRGVRAVSENLFEEETGSERFLFFFLGSTTFLFLTPFL